jgi:hypothetical protein
MLINTWASRPRVKLNTQKFCSKRVLLKLMDKNQQESIFEQTPTQKKPDNDSTSIDMGSTNGLCPVPGQII